MTDFTFFNFNRPPNGSFVQQSLGGPHGGQQQASFDINEFPSLSKMSLLSQMQASSRANYVNIAKDNTTTNNQSSSVDNAQSEFTISSEDFPALPGSNNPNVSIIGTKASGSQAGANKTSSSTTSSLNNQTSSSNNIGSNGSSVANGSGGATANPHDIGATAAIDQCGREKSYFSPMISASQKSMWMNGAVDRSTLLGSPSKTSFLDHKKITDEQQQQHQQAAARFKMVDGLSDYTNDFSKDPIASSSLMTKDGLTTTSTAAVASTNNGSNPLAIMSGSNSGTSNNPTAAALGATGSGGSGNGSGSSSKGVQISNDGRVTNIPQSMVTDQFGMIGLLAFLRAAETDPNLASVTFGTDLTALGLNLTATEKLYPSFAGPWTDQPLKVYEIDYPVPSEYLVNSSIRDKLTQITLKRYHEDTIFFLFYMFPNDMLQIAAAIELYSREWRYHKEEKVWITRAPGIAPSEKTNSYERGTYYIFDAHLWRRVPREFVLEYDRLESKPTLQ